MNLTDVQLSSIYKLLQKIFCLPTTRSTFREVQNAILNVTNGNTEHVKNFFEILLSGQIDGKPPENPFLRELITRYSIPVWVAKEVHEKGEFLHLITSDILTQGNNVILSNTIRRIDGDELHFISDLESTVNVTTHFVNRLNEIGKMKNGKEIVGSYKAQLKKITETLTSITDTL